MRLRASNTLHVMHDINVLFCTSDWRLAINRLFRSRVISFAIAVTAWSDLMGDGRVHHAVRTSDGARWRCPSVYCSVEEAH